MVHDYEGIADDDNLSERDAWCANLGSDKSCVILRNHGLLTLGHTVAEAFNRMYYLEQACRIQVAAQCTGAPLSIPSEAVQKRTTKQLVDKNNDGAGSSGRRCAASSTGSSPATGTETSTSRKQTAALVDGAISLVRRFTGW